MRDDILLRVINQLVEALLKAAGLRKKQDLPAAEQTISDALGTFGVPLDVITRLDPESLANMLGDKRALVGIALLELARVRDAEQRTGDAMQLRLIGERLLAGADVPEQLEQFDA